MKIMKTQMHKTFGNILISIFIVCIGLLFGCKSKTELHTTLEPNYQINIIPSENMISISIDSTTANVSNHLTYFLDKKSKKEYLISTNTFMNELQFFDLNEPSNFFKIPIEMNGPKGIGPIQASHVFDMDSIFVFPTEDYTLYMIDSSNEQFRKLDYSSPQGYTNARPSMLFFSSYPFLQQNSIYLKSLYQTNFRTIQNSELSRIHLGYRIDLNSGITEELVHTYPSDYFSNGMKHYDFSASFSKNAFAYSFFGEHDLYISPDSESELKKVTGKSRYIKSDLPLFPANGDRIDRARYLSTQEHYGTLYYDEYRRVYYRFCYPEVELFEMKEILDNLHNPKKFSIQIFDKDFNIIGETLYENNRTYIPKNAFVGKEGLYISTKHSQNEQNVEEEFNFELFRLVEGQKSAEESPN